MVAMGAPDANREAAFFVSASGALGSMVAVRNFSMIASILEVSPRKFAGLRTVHWPSSEANVRCNFAPLISTLVSLSKSTGIRRLSRKSFRLLSRFDFGVLGNRVHFRFAGNHDVGGIARRRFVAHQYGLRLSVFQSCGNFCVRDPSGRIASGRRPCHRSASRHPSVPNYKGSWKSRL